RLYSGLGKKEKHISPVLRVADENMLRALVTQVASYVDGEAVDARFIVSWYSKGAATGYNIFLAAHKTGKHVKQDETQLLLKNSLEQGAFESALIMDIKQPKITESMLRQIPGPKVIGSYTTYYGTHDSPNRISNIYLVSSFVDNTYIPTGETFSLLPLIGEFTQERGFKEAYVIMGDELVPEYGGGACQIATTLYNSAMLADLEVLRRRNHGIYFSIYPLGRDATVYPPSTDLKFKNNTGFPIVIQAHPFKKGLTFRIIGAPIGKTISFSPPQVRHKYIIAATRDAFSDIPEEKLVQMPAFWTTVVRTVKEDGEVLHTETIKSFYKLHGDKQKVKIRRQEPR
ncbi:MAG: VanW family protein, partial [Candidatus Margulisiibacteriota bacterium]